MTLDLTWLPMVAKADHISPTLRDYVAGAVPIIHMNVPNRWGDAFSLYEMMSYSPTYNMPTYQTFLRAPMHVEHDHDDPTAAKGVVLDAFITSIPNEGWVIYILQAFDRTKDRALVERMIREPSNAFSMAVTVPRAVCSIEQRALGLNEPCPLHKKLGIYNGALAFEWCRFCNFFESSVVARGANALAVQREHKLCLT